VISNRVIKIQSADDASYKDAQTSIMLHAVSDTSDVFNLKDDYLVILYLNIFPWILDFLIDVKFNSKYSYASIS